MSLCPQFFPRLGATEVWPPIFLSYPSLPPQATTGNEQVPLDI